MGGTATKKNATAKKKVVPQKTAPTKKTNTAKKAAQNNDKAPRPKLRIITTGVCALLERVIG